MELEKKYESDTTLKEQILDESMKNIEKAFSQMDSLSREISTLTSTYMKCADVFQQELQQGKQELQEQLQNLGERPEPKMIYREVTKTGKRFLFFPKTWKEMEEQGYDYSECDQWAVQKKEIEKKYDDKLTEIYEMMKLRAVELSRILKLQRNLVDLLSNHTFGSETTLKDGMSTEEIVSEKVQEEISEEVAATLEVQEETTQEE